jgi:hypothetical protein
MYTLNVLNYITAVVIVFNGRGGLFINCCALASLNAKRRSYQSGEK